jgi:hypothetical protein
MRKNRSLMSILVFIITFAFLDRLLEMMLKPFLKRKRKKFIQRAIDDFQLISTDAAVTSKLTEMLNDEADRVYAIVDRSILRERIIRAKYYFITTALTSIILVGAVGGFTGGSFIPFISPLLSATIAWAYNISTISISYHQRVKGGMDSVIVKQKALLKKTSPDSNALIRANVAENAAVITNADTNHQVTAAVSPAVGDLLQLDDALSKMEEGIAPAAVDAPPLSSSLRP